MIFRICNSFYLWLDFQASDKIMIIFSSVNFRNFNIFKWLLNSCPCVDIDIWILTFEEESSDF